MGGAPRHRKLMPKIEPQERQALFRTPEKHLRKRGMGKATSTPAVIQRAHCLSRLAGRERELEELKKRRPRGHRVGADDDDGGACTYCEDETGCCGL